nr:group II intron maturase-specific domain-containing protein [Nitrosomonas sp. Nm132]
MRFSVRGLIKGGYSQSISGLAKAINPIIQGWITYYGTFRKSAMSAIYSYINDKLLSWARRKFKSLQRRKWRASQWLRELYRQYPTLFAHWRV